MDLSRMRRISRMWAICANCGEGFVRVRENQVCCSERCVRRRDNLRHARRIYRNGAPDLSVTLERLFVRDGGRCRMCGRPMTFDCDPQSGSYPSIDHITPIAKGGLHSWDNVQLLCRGCNAIKRDSIIPTMAEPAWF